MAALLITDRWTKVNLSHDRQSREARPLVERTVRYLGWLTPC